MIDLRPYQIEAIESIYAYFKKNRGYPIVSLPTGSGKSLTMAAFIKRVLDEKPKTKIMLLTHVKELIEQDERAIKRYWPEAPVGVWSAGANRKEKESITVAGIQSVRKISHQFSGTNIIIVDECHLISKNENSSYRTFIDGIARFNPRVVVVGFTATEYRLDSGPLVEGEGRLFTDVCYKANVGDLIQQGYLCPLISRRGLTRADLSGVGTRGGEYVPRDLQKAMNTDELVTGAIKELELLAGSRRHVLGFCTGIEHAEHCAQVARSRGHKAEYVSGEMGNEERDSILQRFKSGETRILFNANILTTGFDFEALDCIMILRPTKSTGLHVQILGRGLRKHPSKENTLILDFVGNIEYHGPIDQIFIRSKKDSGPPPVKQCPNCQALIAIQVKECPECQYIFPESEREKEPKKYNPSSDGIIVAALEPPRIVKVDSVIYKRHTKQTGLFDENGDYIERHSLRVTYLCGTKEYSEWVFVEDQRPFLTKKTAQWFWDRGLMPPKTVTEALKMDIPEPSTISVKPDGKWWKVVDVSFK